MISLVFPLQYFKFTVFIFLVIILCTHGATIQAVEPTNVSPSAHFVMVHGASFGGWCWYKVRTLLESAGYNVTCLDLKSAGIDPSNANTLQTFQEYNQPLHDLLSSLPHGEKVILVGHSFGGLSITDAIINFPKKIQVAVYLAAAMVRDPMTSQRPHSLIDDMDCSYEEEGSIVPTSCIFKKEVQRQKFFNKSPLEDSTLASMLLKPFPFKATLGFPAMPEKLKDNVPRVFIKTTDDNLSLPSDQESMIALWPPSETFTVADSDHLAMISQPSELFDILVKIAATNYCFEH